MENRFDDVEKYCMFVGYPRSGHSLIGSLLDAHPGAAIAHELNALEYVEKGTDREQLYRLLLDSSRNFTASGRKWEGYTYRVPNQWQGRFEKLLVIGDKKGGASAKMLDSEPDLLEKLRKVVAVEVGLVHVVRNPYDNISTMFNRRRANRSLRATIKNYFALCAANARLKDRAGEETIFEVRHEDFVGDPELHLGRLCDFLGLDCEESYLRDCASLVFDSPKKTRYDTEWNPGALEMVQDGIGQHDFLEGYAFES